MLVAFDTKGKRKVASAVVKGDEYTCPECLSEVVARAGIKRVPHFAHKVGQACNSEQMKIDRRRKAAARRAELKLQKKSETGQGSLFDEEPLTVG